METLEEVKRTICEMRQTLIIVIEEKKNLLDKEVIAISPKLDGVLNKYNNLLKKTVS